MSFSSWIILILQNPSSFCTGPKMFSLCDYFSMFLISILTSVAASGLLLLCRLGIIVGRPHPYW
jgi:hypothetical protein